MRESLIIVVVLLTCSFLSNWILYREGYRRGFRERTRVVKRLSKKWLPE